MIRIDRAGHADCASVFRGGAHNNAADNEKECDSTGVDVGQVRAMLIENQIRAKNGLPPHAYDGLNKIATSLDKCNEPPPPGSHSPVIYPTCFGPQGPGLDSGGCGTTNGDPHLTTFDGRSNVKPKFWNPKDHAQRWAGRGARPPWFTDHISSGGNEEDMKIPEGAV